MTPELRQAAERLRSFDAGGPLPDNYEEDLRILAEAYLACGSSQSYQSPTCEANALKRELICSQVEVERLRERLNDQRKAQQHFVEDFRNDAIRTFAHEGIELAADPTKHPLVQCIGTTLSLLKIRAESAEAEVERLKAELDRAVKRAGQLASYLEQS